MSPTALSPTPAISVFTPLSKNGNRFVEEVFACLKAQTFKDWEWVVLENHGGKLPKEIREHPQVRRFYDPQLEGIGALKKRACDLCQGEFLFELDHDDLLHETALEETMHAFQENEADFVVSDTAEFHHGTWLPNTYRTDCGWTSYPVTFQGHALLAQPNPPITPQNLRRVEWSPNHLRAFRRKAYEAVGGHDADLPVCDDHELILRLYLGGYRFHHIPKCLYFYRVYPEQTVTKKNQLIQDIDWNVYDKYIFGLAEKFSQEYLRPDFTGLRKIDLCGGIDPYQDYTVLDKSTGYDLDKRWGNIGDGSVGVIRAFDAIEHLKSPIHTMNEAYRVLAPGGFLMIRVPSTDGRGAFQDPTHVSFWNENSFWYYTRATHARYIPSSKARFQVARLRSFFPNDFHRECHIPYVEAHLIALKPGYEPMGFVEI